MAHSGMNASALYLFDRILSLAKVFSLTYFIPKFTSVFIHVRILIFTCVDTPESPQPLLVRQLLLVLWNMLRPELAVFATVVCVVVM